MVSNQSPHKDTHMITPKQARELVHQYNNSTSRAEEIRKEIGSISLDIERSSKAGHSVFIAYVYIRHLNEVSQAFKSEGYRVEVYNSGNDISSLTIKWDQPESDRDMSKL